MKKIVKIVSNILVSTVVAVTSVASMFNKPDMPKATAYSNTRRFVDTAKMYNDIGPAPNIVTNFWGVEGPWCAMYVYFVAAQCGLADTHIPKYSYCDNQYGFYGYKNYYEDRGRFQYSKYGFFPEVGDLVIFDTDNIKDQKGDHIGIVIEIDKAAGYIKTLEGNGKNGGTYEGNYPYYDSSILGYCKTQLDGASSGTIEPAPPVSTKPAEPTQPTEPSEPSLNTSHKKWTLTSPDGGWLRSEPNGTKLGIISTGTLLNSDPSKNQGEWIYVKSAFTLTGTVFDGYVHYTNLTPYSNQSTSATTTTSTVTTTTTTTTTTATTATEAESTTAATTVTTEPSPAETAPQAPQIPANTPSHFISSLIGANGRTSADFDENNIARIIDTDTLLYINYYKDGFANCTIANTGETYFIHTSTISELPPSGEAYTECARANYYVSSPVGCNFRSKGDYSGEILCILDTWQSISVLNSPNELGFVYIEFTYGDGAVHNGYVHTDHITAY